MEKITSWKWRPTPTEPQREDAFYWNAEDQWVYLKKGSEDPQRTYSGEWMRRTLRRKEYSALQKNMKAALDYLNTKLGDN